MCEPQCYKVFSDLRATELFFSVELVVSPEVQIFQTLPLPSHPPSLPAFLSSSFLSFSWSVNYSHFSDRPSEALDKIECFEAKDKLCYAHLEEGPETEWKAGLPLHLKAV